MDLARSLQDVTEEVVIKLAKTAKEITGSKNLVMSGGVALNCVANYEYLKHLPEGTNIYIDPPAYDGGLSIGAAKFQYADLYGNVFEKQETFCLGPLPNYNYKLPESLIEEDLIVGSNNVQPIAAAITRSS